MTIGALYISRSPNPSVAWWPQFVSYYTVRRWRGWTIAWRRGDVR